MKYYLYVSDTKIDMMYAQIPHDTKKQTSVEFGVDLKVIKASRKTEKEIEENRFTRLDAIVDYLETSGSIGSLDEPKEYVRAVMPMKFAPWGHRGRVTHLGSSSPVDPSGAAFVCFGGRTHNRIVVLWGSWKHILGNNSQDATGQFSVSTSLATLAMWDYLDNLDRWNEGETTEEETYLAELRKRADLWRAMNTSAFKGSAKMNERSKLAWALALMVTSELKGPQQDMEFLAKQIHGPERDTRCLLGTPLYVAIADWAESDGHRCKGS
jgi:hypothetical protein